MEIAPLKSVSLLVHSSKTLSENINMEISKLVLQCDFSSCFEEKKVEETLSNVKDILMAVGSSGPQAYPVRFVLFPHCFPLFLKL